MKAVFDTKPSSGYDDDVTRHYQFPRRYRDLVDRAVGDWVILRRPRADGGDLAYFATARVASVEADPNDTTRSFARLEDFLAFDRPMPWRAAGRYAEQALREMPIGQVGVYLRGRSVRELAEADFTDIIAAGLSETLASGDAVAEGPFAGAAGENILDAAPAARERKIAQVLTNRILRDARFRRTVVKAYDDTCAVTGLRIVDALGRSEVQAAHIWPVASGGPDVVQNGIALCATVHWLFDRHLISLSDDHRLLISHNKVPTEFRRLFAKAGDRIRLPKLETEWPHPTYISKHRESFSAV